MQQIVLFVGKHKLFNFINAYIFSIVVRDSIDCTEKNTIVLFVKKLYVVPAVHINSRLILLYSRMHQVISKFKYSFQVAKI